MRPYSTIKVDAVAVGAGCDKSLSMLAVKDHRIVLGSRPSVEMAFAAVVVKPSDEPIPFSPLGHPSQIGSDFFAASDCMTGGALLIEDRPTHVI